MKSDKFYSMALHSFLVSAVTICAMIGTPFSSALADEISPKVRIQTTMGDIVVELNSTKAPQSVTNFLSYVNEGFYNGTVFHRVIDGFMIQGGGFTENLQQKPTKPPIPNEADNGLKNDRGTIAMARTNDPNSATAQFFFNVVNNDFLNHRNKTTRGWGYTVFGKVLEGMEVVDQIRKTPTGPAGPFRQDVPKTPVVILSASVVQQAPALPAR